jgi:serine/threonine protein kinase
VDREYLVVMELADHTLADRIGSGLPEQQVVAILQEIAAGLYELHQAAIIHRDLKPSNVLSRDSHWKLADFGIARDADLGTGDPTFLGYGTLPYMAPELWEGRSPSFKSDLYAVGCIAVELLTGKPPFSGPEVGDFRRQHLTASPPSLTGVQNPALRDLIVRLLNKNPADRPQDSRALAERIARLAIPLTPSLLRLQALSAAHAEERSRNAAQEAAEREQREKWEGWRDQGLADLEEICSDAFEMLTSLPTITRSGSLSPQGSLAIQSEDATLRINLWMATRSPVPDDTLVLVGDVTGSNRRVSHAESFANIVYEVVGGRLVWQLYSFRYGGLSRHYDYGPTDRDHGLMQRHFLDRNERAYMLHPCLHVWNLKKEDLTAEAIVEMFGRALELK